MKNLSILSLVLLLIAGFTACHKEDQTTDLKPISKRVHFDNFEALVHTMDQLSTMPSEAELNEWSKSQGRSNLLFTTNEAYEHLPFAFRAILNEDAEFECNDSIIWYNNGILYGFAKSDEAMIPLLKKTPEKCHIFGAAKAQSKYDVADRTYCMALTGLDAPHQYQFNQQNNAPCGGSSTGISGTRKYIHEIYGFYLTNGTFYSSRLMLRLKLEYRTSTGKWKPAGEQRAITVDVSGFYNAAGQCGPPNLPFSISSNVSCVNNVEYLIGSLNTTGFLPNYWNLSMSGTITHRILGDVPANTWTNSGILW